MRLVHSLNTKGMSKKSLEVNVYYFTLSALYAKRSGFDIVLHTDIQGAHYLQHAPYDDIICDLGDSPSDYFFAWTKFRAMENESEGNIHIDGDVFIKNPKFESILTFDDCDLIVQNVELEGIKPWGYKWKESAELFKECEYPEWMDRSCKQMYNCGVIGFKNLEIQKEYHQYYYNLVDEFNKYGSQNNEVPDLIAEQQLLYDFAKYKNLKVKTILNVHALYEDAIKLGYQHMLGASKYVNLDKCMKTLKLLDEDLFEKTKSLIDNY